MGTSWVVREVIVALWAALPVVGIIGFVVWRVGEVRRRTREGRAPHSRLQWLPIIYWPWLAFVALFFIVVAVQQMIDGHVGSGVVTLAAGVLLGLLAGAMRHVATRDE